MAMFGGDGSGNANLQTRFSDFSSKYKLGAHHTMERFSGIAIAAMVSGALIMGSSVVFSYQSAQADISDVSQYTQGFTSSRTQQKGVVTGVYTNDTKSRAMVMMKMDRPTEMSTNAEDYYVHVSGIKGGPDGAAENVAQPTAGAVYVFGTTGYLGVMLDAPAGFDMQLLNLTVRAKRELSPVVTLNEEQRAELGYDDTFVSNDQWRVIVNPAAQQSRYLPELDSEEQPDPRDLYGQTVTVPKEQALRKELDGQLVEMASLLNRIESYEAAMETTTATVRGESNVRLLPPNLPEWIVGDSIDGLSGVEVREQLAQANSLEEVRQVEGMEDKSSMAINIDTIEGYDMSSYVLNTPTVIPGGYDFDWRNNTVLEGNLDKVVPAGVDGYDYIMAKTKETAGQVKTGDLDWPLSNGMLMSDFTFSGNDRMAMSDLSGLKNNLAQSYDRYYMAKSKYQRLMLQQVLALELEMNQVGDNSTMATGDGAVSVRL